MKKIEEAARRLHTHTVVYNPGSDEEDCAVRAMLGQTTRSIATQCGLTQAQVNYRIKKAGLIGSRDLYRSGEGHFARAVYKTMNIQVRQVVQRDIARKFAPLADRR